MDSGHTSSHSQVGADSPGSHNGKTATLSSGVAWSSVEEGMLQAIVQRSSLPRRSTTEQWEKIADDLARAGEPMGLPVRTASGCRNKARSMGLIPKATAPGVREVAALHVAAQSSFAAPEVKAEVGRAFVAILRRIADELERSA